MFSQEEEAASLKYVYRNMCQGSVETLDFKCKIGFYAFCEKKNKTVNQ